MSPLYAVLVLEKLPKGVCIEPFGRTSENIDRIFDPHQVAAERRTGQESSWFLKISYYILKAHH